MRRALCALLAVAALAGCTGLFFHPLRPHLHQPSELGVAHEDVYIDTRDGVRLHGWFLPAPGRARGTVLFFHGNAENISTHIASVYWLPARGYNVLLPDYRGYGLSQGSPSLPGLLEDLDSTVRYALARPDIDPERLVMFGQSLGGALAADYVAGSAYRANIRALVIDSTFASFRGITREKLAAFWLTWPLAWPLGFTVNDAHSPIKSIARVAPIPLLIIHGERDGIVPPDHGQRLYDAAQEPKTLWRVENAGHIQALRLPAYRDRLVEYLDMLERECDPCGARQ